MSSGLMFNAVNMQQANMIRVAAGATVVSHLSTHLFKYASQLSTHFFLEILGIKFDMGN
jgi:hypothetical protein